MGFEYEETENSVYFGCESVVETAGCEERVQAMELCCQEWTVWAIHCRLGQGTLRCECVTAVQQEQL
jgi:hypothetical protein